MQIATPRSKLRYGSRPFAGMASYTIPERRLLYSGDSRTLKTCHTEPKAIHAVTIARPTGKAGPVNRHAHDWHGSHLFAEVG